MFFGSKNVKIHSQEAFVRVKSDVENDDLEKSAENKKERLTLENFHGHV